MRTDGFGGPEPAGIVDCCGIGEHDDGAHTGSRHQPPHAAILAGQGSKALLQLLPLLEKRIACSEQRLNQG
jgi:hypothetical protein